MKEKDPQHSILIFEHRFNPQEVPCKAELKENILPPFSVQASSRAPQTPLRACAGHQPTKNHSS